MVVVAIGVAGPLGLVGGTIVARAGVEDEDTHSQISELKRHIEQLTSDNNRAKAAVARSHEEVDALQTTNGKAVGKCEDVARALTQEKLRATALQKELEQLETQYSTLLEQSGGLREEGGATGESQAQVPSLVGVETPLGTISRVGVAYGGENMRVGNRKVRSNHAFVCLCIKATRRHPLTDVTHWTLVDDQGRRYKWVAIMAEHGTYFGVEQLAAYGSPRAPKRNGFVYEIPFGVETLDFYIGDKKVGRALSEQIRYPRHP
jgi:hypothetical protein